MFTIELFEGEAPVSTENFLRYIDAGHYDETIFHRVISGFMVQGGGFTKGMREKVTSGTIINESNNGLANRRGTVAMARTSDPNSASAQFFVNVVDNTFLNGGSRSDGYAVFGRVIDGMSVVDQIASQDTGEGDVPVETVEILSARRDS
jgi:cyclophilin family peptidyl-prolyl cis-trans isomerase